jgi:glucose/arabinose dehydrogenase
VQTKAPVPGKPLKVKVETIYKGLTDGWAIEFLPDQRLLITERPGRMRIITPDGKQALRVEGLPRVDYRGQGGLLDVALAPDFASSSVIYFSFSEPRTPGKNGTSLASARLLNPTTAPRLADVRVVFRQKPDIASTFHFGSRIVFARDGTLFLTVGERYSERNQAQNPGNDLGKIIHLNADGTPATDNPKLPGWAPEVWSIGHRNVQGAALHPVTGRLWTVEHGARGGDEVNHPEAGKNYGWPVITYGLDYSGAKIGVGTAKQGMEQPIYYWDPSIAPCGMEFYTADLVPEWKGNLFVAALAGSHIARLVFDGETVVAEEKVLTGLGERFRDVKQGPDGALWTITDGNNARIMRIVPDR